MGEIKRTPNKDSGKKRKAPISRLQAAIQTSSEEEDSD
jgi:hypothetical protein